MAFRGECVPPRYKVARPKGRAYFYTPSACVRYRWKLCGAFLDGVLFCVFFGGFPPGEGAYAAGAPFLRRQKGWKKR